MARRGRPPYPDVLTPREFEVLALLREGFSNEEIAGRLGISLAGAKYHVSEILGKLGVSSREEAARWSPAEHPWWAGALAPLEPLRRALGASWPARGVAVALAVVVAAGVSLLVWGLVRTEGESAPRYGTAVQAVDISFASAREGWLASYQCEEHTPQATDVEPVCRGMVYATTDGGSTWEERYFGELIPTAIRSRGSETGFVVGHTRRSCQDCATKLLVTTDRGQHWFQSYTTNSTIGLALWPGDDWLLRTDCPDREALTCPHILMRSADDGASWHESPLPIEGRGVSISRPTSTDAWVTVSSGDYTASVRLYATHDGARTWSLVGDLPERGEASIKFYDGRRGWALIMSQPGAGQQLKALFGTVDGGMTWEHLAGTLVNSDLPNTGRLGSSGYVGPMVFTSELQGWMALSRAGLLHTSDGGKNWDVAFPQGDLGFYSLAFPDAEHGWAVNNYMMITTADGGQTWNTIPLPTAEASSTDGAS